MLEEIEGVEHPVVMVHDYHLYTLPGLVRRARPDAFLHHFVHIPWSQSDSWRVLPSMMREDLYDGILAHDRLRTIEGEVVANHLGPLDAPDEVES